MRFIITDYEVLNAMLYSDRFGLKSYWLWQSLFTGI